MKRKAIIFITLLIVAAILPSCAKNEPSDTGRVGESASEVTDAETVLNETGNDITQQTEGATEKTEDGTVKLPTDRDEYKQRTQKVTAAVFKSVHQRVGSDVRDIIVYCETEPNSTVYVCDKYNNVLRCERANGQFFYTALPLGEGETMKISIYAKADGKSISNAVKLTLEHTDSIGENVFCGKDSRIFLNWYDDHYYGRVASSEEDLDIAVMMMRKNLEQARELTGKNTKMIVLVATNPAVIYHDRQYDEPFGRGDCLAETSSTLLAKRLEGDPDIYFIDCRDVLLAHRNEDIFYQTDSHWNHLGAYYGYLKMMDYVHKDFPDAPVAELTKYNIWHDYRISDLMTGNFLNGAEIGMREYAMYIMQTPVSRVVNESSPTMYYVGDSYTGLINIFFLDSFAEVTTNELYDYSFYNIKRLKPDYLVYVFTERNLDAQASIVWAQTTFN